MAAAGQQFAMPTAALSSVSAASAAGPMQASKAEDKVNQARNTQADTVKNMVRMQHANPGYANAPEYKALQKSLSKAQAKDAKWSRRLGPDADLPSVGMRTLDALSSASRRSDPFSYFDDADAAMDILGIDQPDAPMGKRLSSETASAISDAEERVRDRQGHIDTMGARNHTFTSASQYTNLPAEVAAQVSGISRLKRFAFRRGLDLGDDS